MHKIVFIGQAPARPSSKHNIPGTYLHAWLHTINFSDLEIQNDCFFYALTSSFPGATKNGHLAPTKQQVALHRPVLVEALRSLNPAIIVPVGKMAIAEVLNRKNVRLDETIGQKYSINPLGALSEPITCIPLSHPSGRSAWNHTHKAQVQQALLLLQQEAYGSTKVS